MGHKFALTLMIIYGSIAYAQTYTVQNETTGVTFVDTLDGTTEFRFSVRLTGASGTLTGVVPELIAPACAQQGGQSIFNATYMGFVGGSSTNLAIPTWSNNQNRELIFRVHMFNNSVVCGGPFPCSGGTFNFQLRFTHSGNSTPITAADPSNNLRISGPPTDGYRVVDVVSETLANACSSFVSVRNFPVAYSGFAAGLLTDPEVKVFLGVDWNLNINNVTPPLDFAFGVQNFFYPIGPDINDSFMLKFGGQNGGQPLAPMVPQSTVILDTNNTPYPLGPLGGDGPFNSISDCVQHTWNFFDITDLQPVSGGAPPIINHLENTGTNTVVVNPTTVSQVNFRKAGLYLVKPAGCRSSTAFGGPPTQIQFEKYNFMPNGVVEVELTLPNAWTNGAGTQLNGSYNIEWFYRNNGTLTKATLPGGGATNAKSLSTNLSIPYTNPSDFVIEARVSRAGTNAIFSVQSPGHELGYTQLDTRSFENAEFNPTTMAFAPDQYLDPGETLVQELRMQNFGSFANDIKITAGRISPASADFAFGSREKTAVFAGVGASQEVFQVDLNTNGVLDLDILFELLQTGVACGDITLFLEFEYVNQGMLTKYRREFSTPANCDFVENAFVMDGNWIDAENFGSPPCNGSNCAGSSVTSNSPTTGWGFTNPNWIGSTNTRAFFYTLTSPVAGFPIGQDHKIAMIHEATFRLLDAGGIAEYRTATGSGPWSNWQDLIEPLETQNSVELYNTRTFTTTLGGTDNVIGGRSVFMDMTSPQSFDLPLPTNQFTGDKIQFRFLYHLVNDASSTPGLWQISDFQYKTKLPQFDDLFVLGNDLNFNTCSPTVILNPQPSGSYTYSWYTSLENLADDMPELVNTTGVWNFPIPAASTDYYVKIRLDSPGTTRVYKLSIDATTAVPPFSNVLVDWNTPGSPGNTDINSSGEVDVIDLILQIILDSCQ